MKKILLAIALILTFSGCSQLTIEPAAEQYAVQNKVARYVTNFCYSYPFFPSGECKDAMEFEVLFGSTKVCGGFGEIMIPPKSMSCFYYDFIKDEYL